MGDLPVADLSRQATHTAMSTCPSTAVTDGRCSGSQLDRGDPTDSAALGLAQRGCGRTAPDELQPRVSVSRLPAKSGTELAGRLVEPLAMGLLARAAVDATLSLDRVAGDVGDCGLIDVGFFDKELDRSRPQVVEAGLP